MRARWPCWPLLVRARAHRVIDGLGVAPIQNGRRSNSWLSACCAAIALIAGPTSQAAGDLFPSTPAITAPAIPGIQRDAHGRIARSAKARDSFKLAHPCPATGKPKGRCPGYVIDHVVPLKRGGADSPANMQWQTTADAKAKDRTE